MMTPPPPCPAFTCIIRWVESIGWLLSLVLLTSCVSTMKEYKGHTVFNPLYLFYLESPKRDHWQLPDAVIESLRLHEGDVVGDIGAGGGYFSQKFADKVGPSGLVYATDVQEIMLKKLRERFVKPGISNVLVIAGGFHDPKLPDHACDLVFFSSVYKEIDQRIDYMRQVHKALKEHGRVAIIEYRMTTRAPGPPRRHRLTEAAVIQEMEAAGFRLTEQYDFLPREYFLVFSKAMPGPQPPQK